MPKDEHGVVGADKNADRQIIVWITHEILQAIQNDTNTDDLSNLKIHSSEPIQGYSMKDAYRVWHSIKLSSICTKFITAYNSKLFSKSKKYVLPYFKALKTILDTQNEYESEKLEALLNAYRDLAKSQIANRRALLNLTTDTGSKLKTAMNQQLTQMDEILQKTKTTEKEKEKKKEIELAQTKFFELLNKIITDLQENYSWVILDRFGDDLNLMISYFEKAYLSEEKLTITHPEYSCDDVTNDCLLRAYPVLKQLSETITKKKIEDSRFENLNKFLKDAYNSLQEDSEKLYKTEYGAPTDFDQDLNTVMTLLL